jgi:hypothetical protein
MALSSLVSVFIPTRPLMMALDAMTTIHMSDMVKLEYSLSDYPNIEKKRSLRHGQMRRDHIDAVFGRRTVSQNTKRLPFDN